MKLTDANVAKIYKRHLFDTSQGKQKFAEGQLVNEKKLYQRENAIISINEDKEIVTTGNPMLNKETKSVKADGTETWFITSKIPYKNDKSEVIGLIGISLHITARKLLEKYLRCVF